MNLSRAPSLPVVLAAVGIVSVLALELRSAEPLPPGSARCRPCSLTPKLVQRISARQGDALEVCELVFELSDQQRAALDRLAAQREIERSQRMNALDLAYAQQARAFLSEEQGKELSGVVEAMTRFRAAMAEAAAPLAAEGGAEFARLAREGRVRAGTGLLPFLNLTPEQERRLRQLESDRLAAMREGRKDIPVPQAGSSPAAMREYRAAIDALYEGIDAQFERDVAALLTRQQRAKLGRLEEGLKRFERAKSEAQQALKRDVTAALGAA